MQTTLGQYNEVESQQAFTLQNSKLLKIELQRVTVQAKLGSMVAYQGDVTFEHAGSGGMSRMLKKAVTGEGTQLMKITGTGEVFVADTAQDIHLIYLENDTITVNGPNLLAFDAGIDWDIKRLQGGGAGAMAGGLFNMELQGTGWVAILSDGPPVLLNVAVGADVRRRAGRDHLVLRRDGRAQDRLQDEEPDRPRLGRVAPAGLPGPGLGARAAVRGPADGRRRRRRRRRRARPPAERLDGPDELEGLVVRRRAPRRSGTTSAPAAACRRRAWRSGSPPPAARAPVGQQAQRAGQLAAGRR